jgi:hypothetical protein
MNDDPKFDPKRSAAIRDMLLNNARSSTRTRASGARLSRRAIAILAIVAGAVVLGGAGASYALAGGNLILTPGTTAGGHSTIGRVPDWPRNAHGLTYGIQGNSPIAPDLIRALATNGRTGYIYSKDLDKAEGPMPTSPAQASTWNVTHPPKIVYIPVYLRNGTTKIGVFEVGN